MLCSDAARSSGSRTPKGDGWNLSESGGCAEHAVDVCQTGGTVAVPMMPGAPRSGGRMGCAWRDKQGTGFPDHMLFVFTEQHHGGETRLGVPPVGR